MTAQPADDRDDPLHGLPLERPADAILDGFRRVHPGGTLYVLRGGRYVVGSPRRGEQSFTRERRGDRWRYVPVPPPWWAYPLPAPLVEAKLRGWLVLDRDGSVPGWDLLAWWREWCRHRGCPVAVVEHTGNAGSARIVVRLEEVGTLPAEGISKIRRMLRALSAGEHFPKLPRPNVNGKLISARASSLSDANGIMPMLLDAVTEMSAP